MDSEVVPPTAAEIARENLVIWMNNVLVDCALQGIALQMLTMTHAYHTDLNAASFDVMPNTREKIEPERYATNVIRLPEKIRLGLLMTEDGVRDTMAQLAGLLRFHYASGAVVRGSVRLMASLIPGIGDYLEFTVLSVYRKGNT